MKNFLRFVHGIVLVGFLCGTLNLVSFHGGFAAMFDFPGEKKFMLNGLPFFMYHESFLNFPKHLRVISCIKQALTEEDLDLLPRIGLADRPHREKWPQPSFFFINEDGDCFINDPEYRHPIFQLMLPRNLGDCLQVCDGDEAHEVAYKIEPVPTPKKDKYPFDLDGFWASSVSLFA